MFKSKCVLWISILIGGICLKINFNEKYNTISWYVVVVFTVCVLIAVLITQLSDVCVSLGKFLHVLSPIIWGIVIAYLINPLMSLIEKLIVKKVVKQDLNVDFSTISNDQRYQVQKKKKCVRAIAVGVSELITIILIIAIVAMIVPEIINSISGFFDNLSYYMSNLYLQVSNFLDSHADINSNIKTWFDQGFSNIQKEVLNLFSNLQPKFESIVAIARDGLFGILGGLKDFSIGLIISIYLLYSKEEFIAQIRKCMYAIFPNHFCEKVLVIGSQSNDIFYNFIVGKAVDSLIIGFITLIVLNILNMPYVVLISLVVGVTNMIPFFGPFIGAIPSAVLVLLSKPDKTLAFVIFIIILQQIDGNIIGPKILGDKMGISTFWIMFAIVVFGGLFNFVGMLIGVPVFTILYTLANSFIEQRLKEKNMPQDKRYYGKMHIKGEHCDFPQKREFDDENIDESVIHKENPIMDKLPKTISQEDVKNTIKDISEKFKSKNGKK